MYVLQHGFKQEVVSSWKSVVKLVIAGSFLVRKSIAVGLL